MTIGLPDQVIASIRSANTAGDPEWIVQNFVPTERAGIQKDARRSRDSKRNQDYYKTARKVGITGSAQSDNQWKQTNILSSVWMALCSGTLK